MTPTRLLPKDVPASSQSRGYSLSELDDDAIIAALKEINALADHYSQHTSSAIRQLSLGGLAVIWLFKVQAGAAAALPRDMYKPALFLIAALALDFVYWAFGALVWKVGRRYLMGDPAPKHIA